MRFAIVVVAVGCGRVGFDPPDPLPCGAGAQVVGNAATDVSQSMAGDACNVGNVLALDGAVAGLDRSQVIGCSSMWDPQGSCGCVAIDLSGNYQLASVEVWAARSGDACGKSPCTMCNSGDVLAVLAGLTLDTVVPADTVMPTSASIAMYSANVAMLARYVVLCRQAYSAQRDDIVVDYVTPICQ
jgi:hypothetical protein